MYQIDVKFTYNWKNAEGIEKLDAPSSEDRYDLYAPGNVLDKSELEMFRTQRKEKRVKCKKKTRHDTPAQTGCSDQSTPW